MEQRGKRTRKPVDLKEPTAGATIDRLEAAAAVIESERGTAVAASGARRLLRQADATTISAALAVPGTVVLWPATKASRRAKPAPTILTEVVKDDPLLKEVDRRVWWSKQGRNKLALRLYAATWDDGTVVLWTTSQPGKPTWPEPTPDDLQRLHAQAQRADEAPAYVVTRRAPMAWRADATQSVGV